MLQSLREIAFDRSDEARAILLRLLTEQVFNGRDPSEAEIAIYADIVARLLGNSPIEIRAFVSANVADRSDVPKSLIEALANDVVIVAAPVLRRSPLLTDDDIRAIAETATAGHLAALASRNRLEPRTTDLLIRRGDIIVFRALAENSRAVFSAETVDRLITEADKDEELCQLLSRREDLSKDDTERIVKIIARRLRNRMMSRLSKRVPAVEPVAPPEPVAFKSATDLIKDVEDGKTTLDVATVLLAKADRHTDLAALLAFFAKLEALPLLKVLVRTDANGIMTVARALGLETETWKEIAEFRMRRLRLSDTQMRYEVADFLKIDIEDAKKLMTSLAPKRTRGLADPRELPAQSA